MHSFDNTLLDLRSVLIDTIFKATGIVIPARNFDSIMQSISCKLSRQRAVAKAVEKLKGTGYTVVLEKDLKDLQAAATRPASIA